MSDSLAAPVSCSSQNPSQSHHDVTTAIRSKSDETSDIQKMVDDPSIPPYLQGGVPNLYYIDPRDIVDILKGREAREKKLAERREREERRSAGEIVASPPGTPKKPQSPPRPYFQWGRSWAENRDETKAFAFARKRAHRLLNEAQTKAEPKDATVPAIAATVLPSILASDEVAAISDPPSQESHGRQRRRYLPTTPRKRSLSPRYVPATPSPKRNTSERVGSAHQNITHRPGSDAGWNDITLIEATSSKPLRAEFATASGQTKASESFSPLQPSFDNTTLHASSYSSLAPIKVGMDPAHLIQIPLIAFDELLAARRQLSQENDMLRQRLRLVEGGGMQALAGLEELGHTGGSW